jgi:hypothetical protein
LKTNPLHGVVSPVGMVPMGGASSIGKETVDESG